MNNTKALKDELHALERTINESKFDLSIIKSNRDRVSRELDTKSEQLNSLESIITQKKNELQILDSNVELCYITELRLRGLFAREMLNGVAKVESFKGRLDKLDYQLVVEPYENEKRILIKAGGCSFGAVARDYDSVSKMLLAVDYCDKHGVEIVLSSPQLLEKSEFGGAWRLGAIKCSFRVKSLDTWKIVDLQRWLENLLQSIPTYQRIKMVMAVPVQQANTVHTTQAVQVRHVSNDTQPLSSSSRNARRVSTNGMNAGEEETNATRPQPPPRNTAHRVSRPQEQPLFARHKKTTLGGVLRRKRVKFTMGPVKKSS